MWKVLRAVMLAAFCAVFVSLMNSVAFATTPTLPTEVTSAVDVAGYVTAITGVGREG